MLLGRTALLVASMATLSSGSQPFADKAALKTAVDSWIADKSAATTTYGAIADWDTSLVTDFTQLCNEKASFDEDLGKWDTSRVTTMHWTFRRAKAFRGVSTLNGWDTSKVTSLEETFRDGFVFTSELNAWDTSRVTNMVETFYAAKVINVDLNSWDTTSVTVMKATFGGGNTVFAQDISSWFVCQIVSANYDSQIATFGNSGGTNPTFTATNDCPDGCTLFTDGCGGDANAVCSLGNAVNSRKCTCNAGFCGTKAGLKDATAFSGCAAGTNQVGCETSTANQCSTTATTKTPCTKAAAGYYLVNDVATPCTAITGCGSDLICTSASDQTCGTCAKGFVGSGTSTCTGIACTGTMIDTSSTAGACTCASGYSGKVTYSASAITGGCKPAGTDAGKPQTVLPGLAVYLACLLVLEFPF